MSTRPPFVKLFNSYGAIGRFLKAPGMTVADHGDPVEPSVRRFLSFTLNSVNKLWRRVVYLSSSAQRPPAPRWCWGRKLPDPSRQGGKEFCHDVTDSINQKNEEERSKKKLHRRMKKITNTDPPVPLVRPRIRVYLEPLLPSKTPQRDSLRAIIGDFYQLRGWKKIQIIIQLFLANFIKWFHPENLRKTEQLFQRFEIFSNRTGNTVLFTNDIRIKRFVPKDCIKSKNLASFQSAVFSFSPYSPCLLVLGAIVEFCCL